MKTLKILGLAIIALLGFNACEDDDNFTITNSETTSAAINLPQDNSSIVLDIENPDATAVTVVWAEATYSIPTAVTYTLELASADTNFENAVEAGTTTDNFFSWSNEQLNGVAVDILAFIPFTATDAQLRIRSTIGDSAEASYSDPITFAITPYTTSLPRLAVPGSHQGWNPSEDEVEFVPYIASSGFGETDYEGFVWLDDQFKLVGPNDSGAFVWGNDDWGDASGVDGSYTEVLTLDGEGNIGVGTLGGPGYYWVQANTDPEELTYSVQRTSWGIIGSATPSGWDADTDMTYDADNMVWTITVDLVGGNEYKFRANDAWDINLGPDSDGDGFLNFGGTTNFTVENSGTYLITLDLSSPREYTQSIVQQ